MDDASAERVEVAGRVFHLVGSVRGLAAEADHVAEALDAMDPAWVALGVAPEDLEGIGRLASGESYEHDYSEADDVYAHFLAQFGPVELPPPELLVAYRWAATHGAPLVAIDLPEATYVEVYTQEVSAWQLLRYGRRVRKLAKRPPPAEDALAFHLGWDREVTRLSGFARVERAREQFMAQRLLREGGPDGPAVVILEAARLPGVVRALREGPARAADAPSSPAMRE